MKNKKLLALLPALLTASMVLSGCVQRTSSGKPYGWVYENMAIPTQHFLMWLTHLMGNSLGWAIILLTFIVRLILMPIMLNQSKNATIQQERMAHIKPLLEDITKRQKAAQTEAEKMAINQEMMRLYRENNISMTGGIGCLPLLIQMPIFAALYAAIQYSPALSKYAFFGINLGQKNDFILALVTFAIYALQGWISLLGVPEAQKKQMQSMMIISPLMITFMTWVSPAGLGLYFFVGGIFACLQTLIINFMRPRIRAEIAAEMKKNPPKAPAKVEVPKVDSKPAPKKAANTKTTAGPKKQRNAGKQPRRKR